MDALAPETFCTYRTIAPGSVSTDHFAPAGTRVSTPSSPFLPRVSTLLRLGVFAAVAAFIVGRENVAEAVRWNARESHALQRLPNALYSPSSFSGAFYAPQPNPNAMRSAPVEQFAPFGTVLHADTTNDDFSLDERLPSGQCGSGCFCRARLSVVKEGYTIKVKAGYLIGSQTSKAIPVPSFIKTNIAETTKAEATSWATVLLPRVEKKLSANKCTVTVADVAAAIQVAQQTAVDCKTTNEARCDTMVPLAMCQLAPKCPPPTRFRTCEEFVRSGEPVTSFEDLQSHCPEVKWVNVRAGISLPFCTTKCPGRPGVAHTVRMDFFMQVYNFDDNRQNCVAQMLPVAYNTLYSTVPSCAAAPTGYTRDQSLFVTIASYRKKNVPEELIAATKACGSNFAYAYFTSLAPTLEDVVRKSCAAM